MGMLDNARRKVKDWTTSDENIQGSPKEKIRELSAVLGQLTPQERERNVQHVKAYLDYYFVTHQGEKKVPAEMQKDFRQLVEQSNRLTAVDNARVVLQQYGGPPTRDTLNESLERSAHQRAKEFSPYRVEPTISREMSWKDLQPQQDQKQGQTKVQTQERTHAHTVEATRSIPQQSVTEPARQSVTVEAVKSPQQAVTEPSRSPQEMSKDELRVKMDQLERNLGDLRSQSKTVPVAELSTVRENIKSVQADLGKYDAELTSRLSQEFRHGRQGPVQEPSWKDLHPKQERAPAQKQENSQEQKQEKKQGRSRGQGMEISA